MFLLYYWLTIAIKLYSIYHSFFISGILLQQPRAPLEDVSAHFSNIYCIILEEMRGRETFDLPGQTSQQLLDPFSSDSVVQQKRRCSGAIFEISAGHRKSRIYPNQKNCFTDVFQLKSRLVFVKKNLGVSLAYGWRMGNLNWPIRIQQAGKNLVSSRQCKFAGKALKSGMFSHWRWHEIFTKGDLQFPKPYHIAKSENYETFCVYNF